MMMKKVAAALFASSLLVAWGAGNATAGKAVYDRSCKNCHGADGVANPAIAKMMKVEIKPLGSADVQGMTDEQIAEIITKGKGKMHAIRSVTGEQVNDVVAFVRTLKK
jgi:mono/diheme cytochrome c family protein